MKEDKGDGDGNTKKDRIGTSSSEIGSELEHKLEYRGEFYGEAPYYIGIGTWSAQPSEDASEVVKNLNALESACLVSLLEDAVDELTILRYVIGAPYNPYDFYYKTLKERYTRRLTPDRIYPQADSHPALTSDIKLERNREQIEGLFHRTIKTLEEDGTFSPLSLALDCLGKEEEDDSKLIQELKENLEYLKELRAKVEEKRKLDDLEEKERDELLYQLQDDMDDIILKCNVEEKFVNKWENVRNAQNQWKLRNSENYYKDNIAKYTTKMKMEKRVTYEMQLYLKLNQAELEEQLEEWMARYDSEMERRENKILQLRYNRDQAEENKHNLQKLYETRKTEMKNWVTFRTIRMKRAAASLQIQSWWRGVMVRKKLGPYKAKKQKGGDNAGKKPKK